MTLLNGVTIIILILNIILLNILFLFESINGEQNGQTS